MTPGSQRRSWPIRQRRGGLLGNGWHTSSTREIRIYTRAPRERSDAGVRPRLLYLPTDVTLEFQKSGILTRAEFQRLCDPARTSLAAQTPRCADRTAREASLGEIWNGAIFLLAESRFFFAGRYGGAFRARRFIRVCSRGVAARRVDSA